jgi:hypothetical protein
MLPTSATVLYCISCSSHKDSLLSSKRHAVHVCALKAQTRYASIIPVTALTFSCFKMKLRRCCLLSHCSLSKHTHAAAVYAVHYSTTVLHSSDCTSHKHLSQARMMHSSCRCNKVKHSIVYNAPARHLLALCSLALVPMPV